MQHVGANVMTTQQISGAVLELRELGEELAREQVRRRGHLAIPHPHDRRPKLPVRVQHLAVRIRRHEWLIGQREHGRFARRERFGAGAERRPHSGRIVRVHDVANLQALERRHRAFVFAAEHDDHFVEARVTDLTHGTANNGLVAERQQQLRHAHAGRCTSRKHDGADHGDQCSPFRSIESEARQ